MLRDISICIFSLNRVILEKHLPTIISCIDIVKRIHIAVFYFSGVYYDLAKRIVGIRYVCLRNRLISTLTR
jgi:hypothetical protein